MNYFLALVAVVVLSVFVLGRLKIVALVCFTVVRDGAASTMIINTDPKCSARYP